MSFQYSNPKVAGRIFVQNGANQGISTHSRPKAAGGTAGTDWGEAMSFNTQPPKGGWLKNCDSSPPLSRFNTQPPKGGWAAI